MAKYKTLNVKLSTSQLKKKSKSGIKNGTEAT